VSERKVAKLRASVEAQDAASKVPVSLPSSRSLLTSCLIYSVLDQSGSGLCPWTNLTKFSLQFDQFQLPQKIDLGRQMSFGSGGGASVLEQEAGRRGRGGGRRMTCSRRGQKRDDLETSVQVSAAMWDSLGLGEALVVLQCLRWSAPGSGERRMAEMSETEQKISAWITNFWANLIRL
jgi:hypothetical protein